MKIGVVGKPNVGKSTFFKAATLKDVAIGNYPFTTIDANQGVGYIRAPCPDKEFGITCTPQHGSCMNHTRFVPVELVDVAGLVPGAHEGRGLGNKFLDDLRQADALVHVVDASGSSDAEGNPVPAGTHEPADDVRFLEDELDHWIFNILNDNWLRLAKKAEAGGEKIERVLHAQLTGLGVDEAHLHHALREAKVDLEKPTRWGDAGLMEVARAIRRTSKPVLVVLNKADKVDAARVKALQATLGEDRTIPASAESEVALRNAAKHNLIAYEPGAGAFELTAGDQLNAKQRDALELIRTHVLDPYGTTGVLQALEKAVYGLLGYIVAYPVEDEAKLTDKKGNVLPDAHLVPKGTTAKGLAYRVHTDLGEHFIRAIDARSKRAVGADHELEDGAVVRIVSHA